jgi:RimJ/RimL family protein N-acetyltransferase
VIETDRLILRPWREADRAPFLAMSADPEVMYWLGGVPTPTPASNALPAASPNAVSAA